MLVKKREVTVVNLLRLRYFVELAQTEHYTRAAERLCITQPSLSHAIAQLESELGVPLFEKSGRGTKLTHFGQQFLACARNTLATLDEGVEELRRVGRGEGVIRLGLLRTLGVRFVPDLAARYLAANPGKDIRFTFHTGVTSHLLQGLAERQYDLVFASQPAPELGFTAIPVDRQDLVLIVPRNHPLAQKHTVDLEEATPSRRSTSPPARACGTWWTGSTGRLASGPSSPMRRRRTTSSRAWWPTASASPWCPTWRCCCGWM